MQWEVDKILYISVVFFVFNEIINCPKIDLKN